VRLTVKIITRASRLIWLLADQINNFSTFT
jgi:hypothetical protein